MTSRHTELILLPDAPKWLHYANDKSRWQFNELEKWNKMSSYQRYASHRVGSPTVQTVDYNGTDTYMMLTFTSAILWAVSWALVATSFVSAWAILAFAPVPVVFYLLCDRREALVKRYTWIKDPTEAEYLMWRKWLELPTQAQLATRDLLDYAFRATSTGSAAGKSIAAKAYKEFDDYCDSVTANSTLYNIEAADPIRAVREQRLELERINKSLREERELTQ